MHERGTTPSCPSDSSDSSGDDPGDVPELEIHFEEPDGLLGRLSGAADGAPRIHELGRLEAELAEERRKRAEALRELEQLEERYETVMRERSALDASARTLHERFRARTERLYRTLLHKEGGIGAQVADATRELMEASEHLIRLQADRDSLIRQVERLRIALRRANGFEGSPASAAVALDAEVVALFHGFKGDLERRLLSLTRGLEDRLDALASRMVGPAAEPPPGSLDYAVSTRRFYGDGPLIEPFGGEPPHDPAPVDAPPPASEPIPALEPVPDEPVLSAPAPAAALPLVVSVDTSKTSSRVAPAAVGMERILETRRQSRSSRLPCRAPGVLRVDLARKESAPGDGPGLSGTLHQLAAGSRFGLPAAAACVAGVVVSLLIAGSTIPERAASPPESRSGGDVAGLDTATLTARDRAQRRAE